MSSWTLIGTLCLVTMPCQSTLALAAGGASESFRGGGATSSLLLPRKPRTHVMGGGEPRQRVSVRLHVEVADGKTQAVSRCDVEIVARSDEVERVVLDLGDTDDVTAPPNPDPRSIFVMKWRPSDEGDDKNDNVYEGYLPDHGNYVFSLRTTAPLPDGANPADSFTSPLVLEDLVALPAPPKQIPGIDDVYDTESGTDLLGTVITIDESKSGSGAPIVLDMVIPRTWAKSFGAVEPDGRWPERRTCPNEVWVPTRGPTGRMEPRPTPEIPTVTITRRLCIKPRALGMFAPMPMLAITGDAFSSSAAIRERGYTTNVGVGLGMKFGFRCWDWDIPAGALEPPTEGFELSNASFDPRDDHEKKLRDVYDAPISGKDALAIYHEGPTDENVQRAAYYIVSNARNPGRLWNDLLAVGIYGVSSYDGRRGTTWAAHFKAGFALTLEFKVSKLKLIPPRASRAPFVPNVLHRDRRRVVPELGVAIGGRIWAQRVIEQDSRFAILIGLTMGLDFLDPNKYHCGDGKRRCTKEELALFVARTIYQELAAPEQPLMKCVQRNPVRVKSSTESGVVTDERVWFRKIARPADRSRQPDGSAPNVPTHQSTNRPQNDYMISEDEHFLAGFHRVDSNGNVWEIKDAYGVRLVGEHPSVEGLLGIRIDDSSWKHSSDGAFDTLEQATEDGRHVRTWRRVAVSNENQWLVTLHYNGDEPANDPRIYDGKVAADIDGLRTLYLVDAKTGGITGIRTRVSKSGNRVETFITLKQLEDVEAEGGCWQPLDRQNPPETAAEERNESEPEKSRGQERRNKRREEKDKRKEEKDKRKDRRKREWEDQKRRNKEGIDRIFDRTQ